MNDREGNRQREVGMKRGKREKVKSNACEGRQWSEKHLKGVQEEESERQSEG